MTSEPSSAGHPPKPASQNLPARAPASAPLSVNGWNGDYIMAMYEQWAADPHSLDPQWQQFFTGFDLANRIMPDEGNRGATAAPSPSAAGAINYPKQSNVDALIYEYRDVGHLAADLDPLGTRRELPADLRLESFELSDADLDHVFDPGTVPLPGPSRLRDIIEFLTQTYCGTIGAEYMHLQDREKVAWLQQKMEPLRNRPQFSQQQRQRILQSLVEADGFENFLDTRYKGKKRFGLEGGETLIPMLHTIVESGPALGANEFVFSMAHRGRLNVLVNILQKTYDQIFTEFEEAWVEDFVEGGGDVKYHRGYSSDLTLPSGDKVHLSLGANPSHLEFGHSVQVGRTRAKQRLRGDLERKQVVPILIHGDAAFPGQGIVAELFNMMNLDGYRVGGSIHLIINNQVGFTTDQKDLFSGRYCTDIAKFVEAPIFHVNLDDPEGCAFIAHIALEWRQRFQSDIVIDLWCYRKYGHNEGDDPTLTQPQMYERVRARQPVLQKYAKLLIADGVIGEAEYKSLYEEVRIDMDSAQSRAKAQPVDPIIDPFRLQWVGLTEKYSSTQPNTAASREAIERVAKSLGSVPEGFAPHKTVAKLLQYRAESVAKDEDLNWAMGELLAYGTLLLEGHAVRVTGQDVERGTFAHRHAVVFDQHTGAPHIALNALSETQAKFCIHNSPLTENACVGFEYGYSMADPRMLIVWEAQFGDFANGAQVIFDQFIASAEAKWQRFSGLVLFLPHGYEGQGPEHSSARLERFLQLCADNNMQVVYPTTPAQMFHVLRRQMKRNFRKPLIVMTPKSLLRLPAAVSRVSDLTEGQFRRVLDDPRRPDPDKVHRILLCSGKIFFDLDAHRESTKRHDVAIIRLEQLYPFPEQRLKETLDRYGAIDEVVWVQEEPRNMGAYRFAQAAMKERLDIDISYVGRDSKPSPAVASEKMHKQEQEKILISAVGLAGGAGNNSSRPNRTPVRARLKSQPHPVGKSGA